MEIIMSLNDERALAGSIGAHMLWASTTDPAERSAHTAPARAAFEARFLKEADGDPVRAEHLRRAHFQRLSLKAAHSRRKAREAAEAADAAKEQMKLMGGEEP
jgi:hypothetical protein